MVRTDDTADVLQAIDDLEKLLHERAERRLTEAHEEQYTQLRRQLLKHDGVKARLPTLICSSANLSAVWSVFREHSTWQARRQLVTTGLEPLRAWLEGRDDDDEDPFASVPDGCDYAVR